MVTLGPTEPFEQIGGKNEKYLKRQVGPQKKQYRRKSKT
jgi:hypothetical protein